MKLHPPFAISPRLCPGLRIGNGWLSCDKDGFVLDAPEFGEYRIPGFRPGAATRGHLMFSAILGFLGASAESYRYRGLDWSKVTEDDNAAMFNRAVVEWAYGNSDEIGMLEYEIEESETQLIEP